MNQDDFRRLMATPRAAPPSTPKPGATSDGFAKPAPVKPKKKYYPPRKVKKPQEEEEEEEESQEPKAIYRDRAEERRKGINPDYADSEDMIRVLTLNEQENVINSMEEAIKSIPEEQSKYLGGDVEHTHLVKGLDVALLNKVKRDETLAIQSEKDAVAYVEKLHGPQGPVKFKTGLAETIYNIAMKRISPPKKNEHFHPGRMTFQWDLGIDGESGVVFGSPDAPFTILKSRSELKGFDTDLTATTRLIVDKVCSVFLQRAQTLVEKTRIKRKDKERAQMEAEKMKMQQAIDSIYQEEDDDDDIFADAGTDYVVSTTKQPPSVQDKGKAPAYYFDTPDSDQEESEKVDAQVEQLLSQAKQESQAETSLRSMKKEKILKEYNEEDDLEYDGLSRHELPTLPTLSASNTTEPSKSTSKLKAADFEGVEHAYDSGDDDEVNYDQMDLGTKANKRRQLTRFDFENEEEWFAYKESQVHLPKAAFQFGVKASDGRVRHTAKQNEGDSKRKAKRKLEREFQQLDSLMSKKYGKGLRDPDEATKKKTKR